METEEILFSEKSKEKESREIARYELDPEEEIDVVIEVATDVELPQHLKDLDYVSARVILKQKEKDVLNFNGLLSEDHKLVFIGRGAERLFRKSGSIGDIWEYDDIDRLVIIPR